MIFIKLMVLVGFIAVSSAQDADWWKHAVFYQIYPISFRDTNNDGYGDLKGVIEKIPYLKDLGIDAIWLNPIYLSPGVDGGYDIQNFSAIDPKFGTEADFKSLTQTLHDNGLKLIMDFVPGYTSDQHDWFQQSLKNVAKYKDYYVWVDDAVGTTPPNNWYIVFDDGTSGWTYSKDRKAWYFHSFTPKQPDLNYRSAGVVEDMQAVLKYWLDQGVDGFRIDAIIQLLEDEQRRDETPVVDCGEKCCANTWHCFDHSRTTNLPETYEQVYKWRAFVDNYAKENKRSQIPLMTETYSTLDQVFRYYWDGADKLGAHFSFNFFFLTDLHNDSRAENFTKIISEWVDILPSQFEPNWVWGNHDNRRVASRLKELLNPSVFNMISAILPGVMVSYMGEEFGMEDVYLPFDKTKDPQARDPTTYMNKTRDFGRTPIQWDGTKNCGFNKDASPWLPAGDCAVNNVAKQVNDSLSHLGVYKNLLELRQEDVLKYGDTVVRTINRDVFIIKRAYGGEALALVVNTGNETTLDLSAALPGMYHTMGVTQFSKYKMMVNVNTSTLSLSAHDGIILHEMAGGGAEHHLPVYLLLILALITIIITQN